MSNALIAFWTARLDEDEMRARKDIWCARQATAEGHWEAHYGNNLPYSELRADSEVIGRLTAMRPGLADGEDAPHVADAGLVMRMAGTALPRAERALREVEAGRAILAMYADGLAYDDYAVGRVIRVLVGAYSDHPDYDEEWSAILDVFDWETESR
jgi:hypothetical protein